ncbi:endo alpha-1,4 polygalactosaminidase [Streptomyces millisiae]|uniref:Endo alpha-1,4 polygalactosaminidase n=1 Tax=Streptomyces millisiae TaxID=3075542 RepID=A0ABU2LRU3_9ACTN|nr:endo alpha-1,4 polygalactosaminidase [Streptomyces sp. DSM 44918]MDT0320316.1 endo alpha-1,4 polygalactosaminidase [Streptomyces sp. DSM 44918]
MTRLTRMAAPLAVLPLLFACSAGSADADGSSSPSGDEAAVSSEFWTPEPGTDWQWQLIGEVDTSVDVPVYDIDGFENDAAVVEELHARDVRVICYISAGAWEDFRPDADEFPEEILGEPNGWPGERWLDIRALDVLEPIMAERFDMCADKGFDAVEPDNMDAYVNDSGFDITADDQLAFNRMIADLAHERGLSVGLKNDLDQIPELVDDYDFAVNEQCAQYEECEALTPFVEAGKAVFHAEYELTTEEFCPVTTALGLSSLLKNLDLDVWRETCAAAA